MQSRLLCSVEVAGSHVSVKAIAHLSSTLRSVSCRNCLVACGLLLVGCTTRIRTGEVHVVPGSTTGDLEFEITDRAGHTLPCQHRNRIAHFHREELHTRRGGGP
jgi:hypothetical protein